jgi:acetoin utilization protein AcuB
MRAREVMTKGVVAVSPGTSAEDAWQLMRSESIHHLLVGSMSKPVGVVSSRDLGGRAGAVVRRTRTVSELMAPDVVMVKENDPIRKIANVMRGRSIGCVIVTDGRRATGIITVSDLLELLGRGSDRPLGLTERRPLHHRVPHRKTASGTGVW